MTVRYLVTVPVVWGNTTNRFRVEMEFAGSLTRESAAQLRETAREYVLSKGQKIVEGGEIKIFRQNKGE